MEGINFRKLARSLPSHWSSHGTILSMPPSSAASPSAWSLCTSSSSARHSRGQRLIVQTMKLLKKMTRMPTDKLLAEYTLCPISSVQFNIEHHIVWNNQMPYFFYYHVAPQHAVQFYITIMRGHEGFLFHFQMRFLESSLTQLDVRVTVLSSALRDSQKWFIDYIKHNGEF